MHDARISDEQHSYRTAVGNALRDFISEHDYLVSSISPDVRPLLEAIDRLTQGGKRLRALLAYWGFRAAGGRADDPAIVTLGLSLELFQAAALIHDDIIDRSATRRGGPSVHQWFQDSHIAAAWALDAERYGQAAGILTGDLCLSFSEEAFSSIGAKVNHGTPARNIFNLMRAEVMAGQYLDILEEVAGPGRSAAGALERARTVIRFKSAKYSVEHPLALGAALAGADQELLAALSNFSLPLGEAFQLRDDELGVFGDPDTTGKPAGDDIREGKRTMLVAGVLEHGTAEMAERLEAALGNEALSDDDVAAIRADMQDCGSLAAVESLIGDLTSTSLNALAHLPVPEMSRTALQALAAALVRRKA